MFDFLKSKNPPDAAKNLADIEQVLGEYQINQTSLRQFITSLTQQGHTLNLTLRLPATSDVEKIHHDISSRLHLLGVQEVNMNVTLFNETLKDNRPQSELQPTAGKPLPVVTDAAEPPISKKAPTQAELAPHPRIRHIIVVASGKGGVGKSTTTVNLALALQQLGQRVGVLDADIYGPSIPAMLGVAGVQPMLENEQFVPIDAHGMPMLSIGSLLGDEQTPVAWRGAKATGALMQLFGQTNWPMLDYLIIDMPPGTGDIQLTLAQRIPVTGAVIVTTPQHIALLDAQKGIELFNKTQIPVLGVIENMALHTCSACGHTEAIFGEGGGEGLAEQYRVPLLGQLPLARQIREQADSGKPSVLAGDAFAAYYLAIAKRVMAACEVSGQTKPNNRIF